MKRWIWVLLWVMALLMLSTGVALAQGEGGATGEDSLWITLSPIIAIATMVERMLEIFWGRWEKKDVWPNKDGIADTRSSQYRFQKKQNSQWIGTAFSVIAVGLTNARFFRLLGLEVLFSGVMLFSLPAIGGILTDFTLGSIVDWIVTAAIIGWGGTELVHNVIEGLVKGRNLWKETQQVRAGERQVTDTHLFTTYILPQIELLGLPRQTFFQIIGWLREANVPLDALIQAAVNNSFDALFSEMEKSPTGARAVEALLNLMEREAVSAGMLVQLPNVLGLLPDNIYEQVVGPR